VLFAFNPLRLFTVFDYSFSQGTDFWGRERGNVMLDEPTFHPHQGFLALRPYFLRFPDQNFDVDKFDVILTVHLR